MSRNDLARIQQQLKEAIQAHHVMLSKLKADPNNAELKSEVKKKQAEIASLCDKQRLSVQQVHQEFVAKKPPAQSSAERLPHPLVSPPAAKVIDANGAVPQTSGKKSSTVLNVPHFYSNAPATVPSTSGQPGRASLIVNQSKEAAAPAGLPATSAASSTAVGAQQLPEATASGTASPAGGAPQSAGCASGPPAAPATVPPSSYANSNGGASSMLDGSNLISAYSRLSDAHFLAIAQNTLKRATSPTMLRKLEYLAAVDLIPADAALELQRKRTERKRRTTANPQFSYQDSQAFEAKKHVYLSNASGVMKRPRGRPPSRPPLVESRQATASSVAAANAVSVVADDAHDDFCAVCRRSGQLLLCDTCSLVYHLECLSPPLSAVPDGNWSCPKCIALRKQPVVAAVPPVSATGSTPPASSSRAGVGSSASGKSAMSSSVVAPVQAFIEQKAALEEEKLVLLKHNAELASEKQRLESRVDHLSDTVSQQVQRKSQMRASQAESLRTVQQITDLVRVLQN